VHHSKFGSANVSAGSCDTEASSQGDKWWVEYDLPGGGCVALTNFISDQPSAAAGGTIAFEVENLDALMADLKLKGTKATSSMVPIAG